MLKSKSLSKQDSCALQYGHAPFHLAKPVKIQLQLVADEADISRNIKSVTITLSSLEDAWHIFDDLTNTAWAKMTQK